MALHCEHIDKKSALKTVGTYIMAGFFVAGTGACISAGTHKLTTFLAENCLKLKGVIEQLI